MDKSVAPVHPVAELCDLLFQVHCRVDSAMLAAYALADSGWTGVKLGRPDTDSNLDLVYQPCYVALGVIDSAYKAARGIARYLPTIPKAADMEDRMRNALRILQSGLQMQFALIAARAEYADRTDGPLATLSLAAATLRGEQDLWAPAPSDKGPEITREIECSEDFGVVRVETAEYAFDGQSRKVIQTLFKAAEKNDDGIDISRVGTKIGSDANRFRLDSCFRVKGEPHPGYATLVEIFGKRARIRPELAEKWRSESPRLRQ